MDRLTQTAAHPLGNDTFKRCQLCGHESDDICEFRFWRECDENDEPEPYNILITCRKQECFRQIEEHKRLYIEMVWGTGQPGHLSLLCGDCSHRKGTRCTHPDLKANGGEGLELAMSGDPVNNAFICYHNPDDETGFGMTCRQPIPPFIRCAGLPPDHPRRWKGDSG